VTDAVDIYWRTINQLQLENERLRKNDELAHVTSDAQNKAILTLNDENERFRAIAVAASAFVEHHLHGQPSVPGTLYPMTYAVQDQWHEEWDRRLAALIAACEHA
jgi:FtsZ-binding cell division protein ZapB